MSRSALRSPVKNGLAASSTLLSLLTLLPLERAMACDLNSRAASWLGLVCAFCIQGVSPTQASGIECLEVIVLTDASTDTAFRLFVVKLVDIEAAPHSGWLLPTSYSTWAALELECCCRSIMPNHSSKSFCNWCSNLLYKMWDWWEHGIRMI